MKEVKEPEIKLFGRMILWPENGGAASGDECNSGGGGDCDRSLEVNGENADDVKLLPAEEDQVAEISETKMEEKDQNPDTAEEPQNPSVSSTSNENPATPSVDEHAAPENNPKPENEQTDATNGPKKPLKKPDKVLPCPRCNSRDTKFCYYNNYKVNQPRHFCKNCQRYWTAGGTIRNVPVGAGRRKNKNSTSHCRHITISEALQAARIDPPNGLHHHPGFRPNRTVLSFGLDSSMVSALNLADKKEPNGVNDESSIGSCVTISDFVPKRGENCSKDGVMPNLNGVPYPVPCIPGIAWPFPLGYPMPPYWNCGVPNAWNVVPWVPVPPHSASQKGAGSSPTSPLGKHSRNGDLLKLNGWDGQDCWSLERPIVVPKTLRSDDPEEAAKSSIWEALGIKYDSVRREGLFKALQPKGDEKEVTISASPVLHANPAALSRSICFQESA